MIVLVDQDGPLADFERGFLECWRAKFPNEAFIPLENRKTHQPRDDYPEHFLEKVRSVYYTPGFFTGLQTVAGSISAIREMVTAGHDVWICTTPASRYEDCVTEKYAWIERHLGRSFVKKIIVTPDKTLVRGHVLIDDNPSINGATNPEWEHVVFDAPYNRTVVDKKRLSTWSDWRKIVGEQTKT